jgi:hypothetical protein
MIFSNTSNKVSNINTQLTVCLMSDILFIESNNSKSLANPSLHNHSKPFGVGVGGALQ